MYLFYNNIIFFFILLDIPSEISVDRFEDVPQYV